MNKKMLYTYAILRYVHDVVAGEFLNLGVTLLSPSNGKLLFSHTNNFERIVRAFPNANRQALKAAAAFVQSNIDKLNASGDTTTLEDMLNRALPSDDSSFQWSSIGSGVTSDISVTLEELNHRFVDRFALSYGAPQDAAPKLALDPGRAIRIDHLKNALGLQSALGMFSQGISSKAKSADEEEWYDLSTSSACNDPYDTEWGYPAMGGA